MRRILFLALLAAVIALGCALAPAAPAVSPGNTAWSWQNPLADVNTIRAQTYVDGTTGWMVGMGGLIMRTDDGGATWWQQDSGTAQTLTGVAFASPTTGWAVGGQGVILYTTDGGGSWSRQLSYSDYYFTGVACADDQNVVIVGGKYDSVLKEDVGTILRTTDGGSDWEVVDEGMTSGYMWACAWVGTDKAYAVGDGGAIYSGAPADPTWSKEDTGVTDSLFAVTFPAADDGFAVGADGRILSTDGGGTWSPVSSSGTSDYLFGVSFPFAGAAVPDLDTGFAVGDNGAMVRTTDGGDTWEPIGSNTTQRLYTVAFPGAGPNGRAVGNGGSEALTSDGGLDWTGYDPSGPQPFSWLDAVGTAPGEAWALGEGHLAAHTTDTGAHWMPVLLPDGAGGDLTSLAFTDAADGWVCGDGGVLHTANGGATWEPQDAGVDASWAHIAVAQTAQGPVNGVLVGYHIVPGGRAADLVNTTDGGQDWIELDASGYASLDDVAFSSPGTAWAVGVDDSGAGVVLKSDDGGSSWVPQTTVPATGELSAVAAVDDQHVWALATDGTVVSTQNGGTDWNAVTTGADARCVDISFSDLQNGWIVSGGRVLHTANGSAANGQSTWSWQLNGTGKYLMALDFVNKAQGWVVGAQGAILYTTTGGYPDITGPVDTAVSTSVKKGKKVSLAFTVSDQQSLTAMVTIKIRNAAGKNVKTLNAGSRTTDVAQTFSYKCTLAKGKYTWKVYAVDVSGNPASSANKAKLTVN